MATSNFESVCENELFFKSFTLHTDLVWLWGKKLRNYSSQEWQLCFDWIIIGFGTNTGFGASSGSTFGTATASGGGLFGGGTSGRRNCSKTVNKLKNRIWIYFTFWPYKTKSKLRFFIVFNFVKVNSGLFNWNYDEKWRY